MKVVITNRKADWPAGAAVGDVVEVGDVLPGCLVGKCKPAGEGAEATHVYKQVLPTPVVSETALAMLEVTTNEDAQLAESLKIAERLLAEARAEADELRGMVERAEGVRDAALADRDAALARVAELEAAPAPKKK